MEAKRETWFPALLVFEVHLYPNANEYQCKILSSNVLFMSECFKGKCIQHPNVADQCGSSMEIHTYSE